LSFKNDTVFPALAGIIVVIQNDPVLPALAGIID
jgi:hypothetical protein